MLLQGDLDRSTSAQGYQDRIQQPPSQAGLGNNSSALPAISQLHASRRLSISPKKPNSSGSSLAKERDISAFPSEMGKESQQSSHRPPQNSAPTSSRHKVQGHSHHIGPQETSLVIALSVCLLISKQWIGQSSKIICMKIIECC